MSSPARKFIFGVDLDGVVVDFYRAIKPLAAPWLGRSAAELPDDYSYGLREWGFQDRTGGYDLTYAAFHRHAVNQHELFKTAPAIPGAAVTLRRLSRLGVHIRIITHRLYVGGLHNKSVTQTADWLDAHDVPYRDLCFVEDKLSINADLYIDDAPKNILAYRSEGRPCIIFDNPTNRHLGPELRAHTWDEVYALVSAAVPPQQKGTEGTQGS